MARDGEIKQNILHARATADIMNNQMPLPIGGFSIHNHTDMGQIARQHPGNQISGTIVCRVVADRQAAPLALKEDLQVRHAPVVDVGVGSGQAPEIGVCREIGDHILMDLDLQIDADSAVGTNYHIRAYAPIIRHITVGIADPKIAAVVNHMVPGALLGRSDQFVDRHICIRRVCTYNKTGSCKREDLSLHIIQPCAYFRLGR